MIRTTSLIFLTLATAAKSALECREDYCINCIANVNYTHKCGLCRYRVTTNWGDCKGGIPIDNCESYTEWNGHCVHCKEDYYLSTDSKGCNKIGIDKCRWGSVGTDGKVLCDACDGTYPADDKLSCTGTDVPDTCKYGGVAWNNSVIEGYQNNTSGTNTNRTRYCHVCKKGYSRSANYSHCIDACAHGCYYCNLDNHCTSCDKYNGYYEIYRSRDYGVPKCEHFSLILKVLGVWLAFILGTVF